MRLALKDTKTRIIKWELNSNRGISTSARGFIRFILRFCCTPKWDKFEGKVNFNNKPALKFLKNQQLWTWLHIKNCIARNSFHRFTLKLFYWPIFSRLHHGTGGEK